MARLAAAFLSAFLLILSFPRHPFGFAAWLALVPLLIALRGASVSSSFGISYLFGMVFQMGVFFWINDIRGFTPINFLTLALYLGAFFGLFGLLTTLVVRKIPLPVVLVAPVFWVLFDYLRSHAGFLALPWPLLGHSQFRYLPIIQIASVLGVYGISFLIVMVNACTAEIIMVCCTWFGGKTGAWRMFPIKTMAATALAATFSLVYGYSVIHETIPATKMRVAVVQGNIPQNIKWEPKFRKWGIERQALLTEEASRDQPSLIVWPETSVPGYLLYDPYFMHTIVQLARNMRSSLVVGSGHRTKISSPKQSSGRMVNSAFLISSEGRILRQYDKIRLLPFAEYLPGRAWFPWPTRLADLACTLAAGNEFTIFEVDGSRFGVLICWEAIFPELSREFVMRGARFLLNITNEAWFGESAAPFQFLSMSVFRAVENRVCVVRSANTGISCFISPTGEILGKVSRNGKEVFVDGSLTLDIPVANVPPTFYTRYGDVFAKSNLVFGLVLTVLTWIRSRENQTRGI